MRCQQPGGQYLTSLSTRVVSCERAAAAAPAAKPKKKALAARSDASGAAALPPPPAYRHVASRAPVSAAAAAKRAGVPAKSERGLRCPLPKRARALSEN